MSLPLAYLAQPPEGVCPQAYELALQLSAALSRDYFIYSPEIHNHRLAWSTPQQGAEYWAQHGLNVLARADVLLLVPATGWRIHAPLARECRFAINAGIRRIVLQGFDSVLEDLDMSDFERLGGAGVKFV